MDFHLNANMLRIFLETTRRVSVTQPGPQGPDAVTTRRVRDSASDPARGLGAIYDPACLRDPARASGLGRYDYSLSLRDSAKASGPRRSDYSGSLRDSTQGFRVGVTELGLVTMAISRWLRADTFRGSV